MSARRFYLYLTLSLAVLGTFAFVLFLTINQNSERFSKEFYSQNYQNIESGNAFALIPQLNSILNQDSIYCVVGKNNLSTFFESSAQCRRSYIVKTVEITGKNKAIVLEFEYGLSKQFYIYLFSVFLFAILAVNFNLFMVFRIEDIRNQSTIRVNNIAKQVAHDIRSPLTALNMISQNVSSLREEEIETIKSVVSRINGIADDLLKQSKEVSYAKTNISNSKKSCELLRSVKSIINQKKIELQYNSKINIELKYNESVGGVRVEISEDTLARCISNVINNSVDAIVDNGDIFIEVDARENVASIIITDFGKGIPDHILEKILNGPISYGKESSAAGYGLGISGAIKALKEVSGNLKIISKLDVGTQVIMMIPTVI